MNVKFVSLLAGALCLGAGVCNAAQSGSQGVIYFSGSIVEPSCATNAHSGASIALTGCATASHDMHVDVRKIATVASVDGASARLVSQARSGRYYDQEYLLVDALGKPIETGAYVVTLTSP